MLNAGTQSVVFSGEDPGVEIDAVCVSTHDVEPAERLPEPPVRAVSRSVRDFGAVGDGVADDTAALQAALDSLQPGEALLIPQGRYRFTSTLTLNRHEVSILGQGSGSVLFADFLLSEEAQRLYEKQQQTSQHKNVAGGGPQIKSYLLDSTVDNYEQAFEEWQKSFRDTFIAQAS